MHSIENYTAIKNLIYKGYWIVEKICNNVSYNFLKYMIINHFKNRKNSKMKYTKEQCFCYSQNYFFFKIICHIKCSG